MANTQILIVEDERIVAEDLKETLLELGFSVSGSVGTGTAAIAWVASHAVDMVLMDIKLEGEIDGIETAGILRRRYAVPTIYTTAYSDDSILCRAKATRPLGYLTKPYRASEIKSVLEIALSLARIEREEAAAHDDLSRKASQRAEQLGEMNAALKVLMEYRENEKKEMMQTVASQVDQRVLPHFDTIRMRWPNRELNDLLDTLTTTLKEIVQTTEPSFSEDVNLTPMEARVADLIRQGRTSKEIARLLGITERGVTFHRGNIRRKLGIHNTKVALKTSLN